MSQQVSRITIPRSVLWIIGGTTTFAQFINSLVQIQTSLAKPSLLGMLGTVFLFSICAVCVSALVRKRGSIIVGGGTDRDQYEKQVPYYTWKVQLIAIGVLITNAVIAALMVVYWFLPPCSYLSDFASPISSPKFGVLVADFTKGSRFQSTAEGCELADRTMSNLERKLMSSTLANGVEIKRVRAVTNETDALKAGNSKKASLVVWGNLADYAPDVFELRLTFVDPALWPSASDRSSFEVEMNRADVRDLPTKISARSASAIALVTGLLYLRQGKTQDVYMLAIPEFNAAIRETEAELAKPSTSDEEEIRKTLAMFYVLRGRTYAAMNNDQEAMTDYNTAEGKYKDYVYTYLAKGNHYYSQDSFTQAESEYRAAIRIQSIPSAYYGLGNALYYQGRRPESIQAYQSAITLLSKDNKDAPIVRLVLGIAYKEEGQYPFALEQLKKVVESPLASEDQKRPAQELIALILNPQPTPTRYPPPTPSPTKGVAETPTLMTPPLSPRYIPIPPQTVQPGIGSGEAQTPASVLHTPTATREIALRITETAVLPTSTLLPLPGMSAAQPPPMPTKSPTKFPTPISGTSLPSTGQSLVLLVVGVGLVMLIMLVRYLRRSTT